MSGHQLKQPDTRTRVFSFRCTGALDPIITSVRFGPFSLCWLSLTPRIHGWVSLCMFAWSWCPGSIYATSGPSGSEPMPWVSVGPVLFPAGVVLYVPKEFWRFVCRMLLQCTFRSVPAYQLHKYASNSYNSSNSNWCNGDIERVRLHVPGTEVTPHFLMRPNRAS